MSQKKENPLINIAFNIVIPTLILMKFSKQEYLGPVKGLIIAVAFPLLYGGYDLVKTKKVNLISVLGLVSVLLTGVFTLMKLPPEWIAWKEAGVPLLIGVLVLASTKTKYNLFRKMIFNDMMWKIDKIDEKLQENQTLESMNKRVENSAYLFSLSFFLSAVLNFVLAKVLLQSQPGTDAYNEELGKMTSYSFVVIALPSMIVMGFVLFYFVKGIEKYTGYKLEEVIKK